MGRWRLVILLVILATGLTFSLVEYDRSAVATDASYREQWTRFDRPLLYLAEHSGFVTRDGDSNDIIAVTVLKGFFARPGVPRLAALLGGIILPTLLVLAAAATATRRRWLQLAMLWIAALFLFGMLLDVPAKYFKGTSAADVERQIAANAIHVSKVEAGMSCLGVKPCRKEPYFAFARGVFATEAVPRPLAIGLGIILPVLLIFGSVGLALKRRPRSIPE